jgi:hypothetical protein
MPDRGAGQMLAIIGSALRVQKLWVGQFRPRCGNRCHPCSAWSMRNRACDAMELSLQQLVLPVSFFLRGLGLSITYTVDLLVAFQPITSLE